MSATDATGALCASIRDRMSGYLEDVLAPDDARSVRAHVAACGSCREALVSRDASMVFARPGPEAASADDVARVLAGVRAGIALIEAERKLGPGRSRRRFGAAAAAAALAALVLVLPGSGRRPAPESARLGASTAQLGASTAPAAPAGFAPAAVADPRATFPADATIYDWNPGAGTDEPRVVWIVDRSLDI